MVFFNDNWQYINPLGRDCTDINNEFILRQLSSDLSYFNLGEKILLLFSNPDYEKIADVDNKGFTVIVQNGSDHPGNILNPHLRDVVNSPIIKLSGDFTSEFYYPFWLLASRHYGQEDRVDINSAKQYPVTYLCNKSRVSRIYTILNLASRNYFGEIGVSWGNLFEHVSANDFISTMINRNHSGRWHEFENFEAGVEQFLTLHKKMLPLGLLGNSYIQTFNIDQGMSSYLQIVSESVPELMDRFVSEKIWKPIRLGQLFLVQGNPGTVEYLRQLGFDVFDDYIDHSRYDNEPNWQKRTQLMVSVLDDIYPDIEKIYFETTKRRANNLNRFQSRSLLDLVMSNVSRQIKNFG